MFFYENLTRLHFYCCHCYCLSVLKGAVHITVTRKVTDRITNMSTSRRKIGTDTRTHHLHRSFLLVYTASATAAFLCVMTVFVQLCYVVQYLFSHNYVSHREIDGLFFP